MADTLAQPAQQEAPVQSALIPKGREADYWEMPAPSTHFLDMEIDRANMYIAPLLITNGSEDRDGEVTNPDGLIDAAYRTDPVVFLQHSHRIAPLCPPVGTAETPDHVYDMERRADGWYSGCRFTQAIKFARQVFRLIDDGVLRGRSIGALNHGLAPYKPRLPGVAFVNNQIMPVRTKSVSHEKYELVEWSWVWMPSNREIATPRRDITPSRDTVPLIKGILCRNRLDDSPIDPGLKMVLKSLNLSEPATNLRGGGKVRYWPFETQSYGEKTVETPHAILFSAKSYSAAEALKFLKGSSDIGLIETQLGSENRDGGRFLKSVQFSYNGPTEVVTNPEHPGLVLLFAKAAPEGMTDEVEQEVDVAAAQKPATAATGVEAPVEGSPDVVQTAENEKAEMVKMPQGMRYLKALIKKATEMVDEADAALGEQEPELSMKCKEMNGEFRSLIAKVAEFQSERYGKTDGESEGGSDGGEDEKPATAMLEKSVRADLFYGRKTLLPASLTKGLNLLHTMATDEKQKQLTSLMLKGVIGSYVATPTVDPQAELRERIRQRQIALLTKGITT